MDRLTASPEARATFVETAREAAMKQRDRMRNAAAAVHELPTISAVKSEHVDIPEPPFWGPQTLETVDVRELWPNFDLKSLYRLSWGASNTKGAAFDELIRNEFEPRLHATSKKRRPPICCSPASSTDTSLRPASATTSSSTIQTTGLARSHALRLPGKSAVNIFPWPTMCASRLTEQRSTWLRCKSSQWAPTRQRAPKNSTLRATIVNRTSCTDFPCSRPRRWRNGRIGVSVRSCASIRIEANGIHGDTALVPTCLSTRRSSRCSMRPTASASR